MIVPTDSEEKCNLKLLILSTALLLGIAGSAAAECSNLNTPEFLESTTRENLRACVEANPEIFKEVGGRGYNLPMTAVTSDIDPLALDDLLQFLRETINDDTFKAKGPLGQSLGRLAASKARDPAVIFVLSRYKVSLSDEISEDQDATRVGETPLHIAARRDDGWRIVAALLSSGVEVEEDSNDVTPFDLAMKKPEIGPEALLLAEGEWPDVYEGEFEAADPAKAVDCSEFLTAEFFRGADKADVVACLTDKNQLVAVDRNGDSALHLAAVNTMDPWIIDYILSFSEDHEKLLEKRNSFDRTSLQLAAEKSSSPDVLLHLLAWGADVNALSNVEKAWGRVGPKRGISALHLAASRKDDLREDMILVLLAFHADTMRQDPTEKSESGANIGGRTALHRALLKPDPRVLSMLLEGQKWQEGRVRKLYEKLVSSTLVKQIDDDMGRTALHIATSRPSDSDTLWLLVTYGFSVDEGDKQKITPLMFGAQNFTNADNFYHLFQSSKMPCGKSKTGVTVESALRSNKTLMTIGADDLSGSTLTPLARLKERCPQ